MKEQLYVDFGNRLRKIRTEKGLTIERLSLLCDINKNYISDIERGTRNPSLYTLNRIAHGLGLEIKDLF